MSPARRQSIRTPSGALRQTRPTQSGERTVYNFSASLRLCANPDSQTATARAGLTMVGELDVLELRDAGGHTIARGRRDATLAEV